MFKKSYSQVTFADNFTTQEYNRNDGLVGTWSTNWIEFNDDGSPTTGEVFIFIGDVGLGPNNLAFVGDPNEGIQRTVDLTGATTATLSFNWQSNNLGFFFDGTTPAEELEIAISNNNGASFTILNPGTIIGTNTGTENIDISPFISANTIIRFQSLDGFGTGFEFGEFAIIDNLVITTDIPLIPEITINDPATVNEDAGTIDFTVTYTGPAITGGFNVTYNTSNGSAISPDDYDATTGGSINFDGIIGPQTRTISIPIIDDTIPEGIENFFVNLISASDPSITIIDNQGQGTISANDPLILSVQNISVDESVGNALIDISIASNAPGPFSVDYTTFENTALELSDYTATSGTLNFSGNPETLTISVPIIDNSYGEADETFFVNLSNISNTSIALVNGTVTITDTDPALPTDVPLTLFQEFNGNFDYTSTGGTFRNSGTDTCSITNTSSNQLTSDITATATIESAFLIWTHSGSTPDDIVTFENQQVTADFINRATFDAGREFHSMLADVTDIINSIPLANINTNTFDVTDLNIDNTGNHCTFNTTLGGWSLFIIYEDPNLISSSINFYQGFDGEINNTQSFTLDGFFAIGSTEAKTSILSWEGDDGLGTGELLSLTTTTGTNILNGDGSNTGTTNNPFNATIYDNTDSPIVNSSNTYGIDLDTFDISSFINQGETTATTNVTVGDDFVLLNAVLLKVPSNLIVGTVFEDINYGGGNGRDIATANGAEIENATVELFREFPLDSGTFVLEEATTTDASGEYSFGGMPNGNYQIKVNNNSVRSTRPGGSTCTTCIPIQTFRKNYSTTTNQFANITDEIGGTNPSLTDPTATVTLPGSQTISNVSIENEGVIGLDFGFNFNTIVNTNESGQGSLAQFIIHSNELGETGLDIEAHPNDSSLNPSAGVDTSIFMIPTSTDPFNRPTDPNFNASGYFDIFITDSTDLPIITGTNTHIDGRTQTAYSGNTNTGTVGAGGTTVGRLGTLLPNYNLPEIQVHQNNGDVFRSQSTGVVIRNLAIYADDNSGIMPLSGEITITENLIGVNALGNNAGNIDRGVEIEGTNTSTIVSNNYIATNTNRGVFINGGNSTLIQNNHITENGNASCWDNIRIQGSSSGVIIRNNLIEKSAALGIDAAGLTTGNIIIEENTIRESGQNGGICNGVVENAGIVLNGSNSIIRNNIINNNGGAGIVLGGGNTSGNLISQNSIFANGTSGQALGIDLDVNTGRAGDSITINDTNDSDNGPNGLLNFPIFETATISGNILKVSGWSRPGAILEIFLTDVQLGTATQGDNQLPGFSDDYGEGQLYLTSVTEGSTLDIDSTTSNYIDADGNTDTTNRFNITVTLSANLPVTGNLITATATVANTTSEFSRKKVLAAASVITNRRITYRVRPN
ncbi:beta strand repeat-containing protein [Aquimarina agarilytica]|uniref:beta strand repeat-containing protein n=1 Tax=Aquimarina agarilytica TaxID=1087449 RepID=UPI00031AA107|nr:Calx-beta domain-containing protein [Aquimarina agarilytica]